MNPLSDAIETEGRGLDYERFSLGRLFGRLVQQRDLGSVLEIPAGGEKAMPSIYSLGFAAAGCAVTLVNPVQRSLDAWRTLGLSAGVERCDDLTRTGLPGAGHDLVWNFVSLSQHPDPAGLLAEMGRLSRGYVLFVGVNRFNPGFFSHRLVHRIFSVPWTHGRLEYMDLFSTRRILAAAGLTVVESGVVDAPPYPDSLGIRDMRLHRKGVDLSGLAWRSRTVEWMRSGQIPARIRLMYLVERLPLPLPLKLIYAHLFYVLACVPEAGGTC